MASRVLDRAFHPKRHASEPRTHLEPESRFVVRLSDSEVVCKRPDGKAERVAWADLQNVEVVTTGDRPFAPDVFWFYTGLTAVAPCRRAPLATVSCLSDFKLCQV
jgi:hypothetical protein